MTTIPTENAKTIDEFELLTSLQSNDLFVVVKNRTGSNLATHSVSLAVLMGNTSANVIIANSSILSANILILRNNQTPSNSTITITKGTFLFDSDYLYIATANNTLKRVALSSF